MTGAGSRRFQGKLSRTATWTVLTAALTLPTVASLAYFVWLEGTSWVIPVYFGAKALQFAGPVAALSVLLAAATGPARRRRSAALGLGTGVAGAAGIWLAYLILFRGGGTARSAAEAITFKLADFHLDSLWRYVLAALVISLLHSWLEEVYWRAFVYGWLRRLIPPAWSVTIGAVGYTAHHVVVIGAYVGDAPMLVVLLLCIPLALGGALWSLLYQTTGNRLLAPWISHVFLDLAIMAVGYDLVFGA